MKEDNVERPILSYNNLSQKWCQSVTNYNKQYCSIYLTRLKQITKLLEERIEQKWGKTYPVCKLHKLSEKKHSKCIVIGTLFKDQKLKPSILKQLAEGNQIVPQPIVTRLTDTSDQLYIEDELQRYQIVGSLKCANLVTGITCALLGTDDDKGKFNVEDYVFASYREQIPRPIFESPNQVMFLSGLDLVHGENIEMNLQLLELWLNGFADSDNNESSQIVRVVVAGNSIRNLPEEVPPSISLLSKRPESSSTVEAVKYFDKLLARLSQVVEIDVMPGENDPSNHILPQKPMHYCMFPESSRYKSLNQVSNPYYFSIGGLKILGSSGQPVWDIIRYSDISDPLEALECCLKWNHLGPTAPDTLGCFPFYAEDPFIIEECPHVFFAGNQKEFSTKECT
ncbi:DNA polymerase delta subunit 2, partial [Asbolus verrucosus]